MKYLTSVIVAFLLIISLAGIAIASSPHASIPTIMIVSVDPHKSVTLQFGDLPTSQTFKVTMGMMGTKGVGGIEVGSFDSDAGQVDPQTYEIPDELIGQTLVAVRIQSPQGFFAYNWFDNSGGQTATATGSAATPATTATPAATSIPGTSSPSTIPLITITNVIPDQQVTIQAENFPPNQTFTVTMGKIGTKGVGGIVVDKTDSIGGGAFEATYSIPPELAGSQQIAIRLQSPQGFFSYNWFWNTAQTSSTPSATESATPSGTTTATPGVGNVPTFTITAVVKDSVVTINATNFPAGQTFNVTMGKFGTRGVGGIQVGTTDSGSTGSFQAVYNIPADLKGLDQIAIRLESPQGFFSYNWFWNITFPTQTTG